MSIFTIKDFDNILLSFCDPIDDLIMIKQLNKYYCQIINNNNLFKSWIELYSVTENDFGPTTNNNLFINACATNNLLHKYLIRKFNNINIHEYNEYAFWKSCSNGHLNIVQWLIDLSLMNFPLINIHACNELAFMMCCNNGHLNIAKWLIDLGKKFPFSPINIHAIDELAFQCCCQNGHLHMAQWLLELSKQSDYNIIDIHATNNYALNLSYKGNHFHMIQWLNSLDL